MKNISGKKLGAIVLAAGLGLGSTVALSTSALAVGDEAGKNCGAPAGQPGELTNDGHYYYATCADGATVTIPMKVKIGQPLHLEGTGFTSKKGEPSFIAQKYDEGGGYRPTKKPLDPDGLETLPTDTMDAFLSNEDGSWSHDFELLTADNNKKKVEWKVGEKHSINLLTGSIVDSDNIRGVRVEFEIVADEPDPEPSETATEDPTEPESPEPSETATEDPTEPESPEPTTDPTTEPSESAKPTEDPKPTDAPAEEVALTATPQKISAKDFTNKDKGVNLSATGLKPGAEITFNVARTADGVKPITETVTVDKDGKAQWIVYGTDAAHPESYVGEYKVGVEYDSKDEALVKALDKKNLSTSFTVTAEDPKPGEGDDNGNGDNGADDNGNGDSSAGDDNGSGDSGNGDSGAEDNGSGDNGSGDNGSDDSAGSDDSTGNDDGDNAGNLPKTGMELTAAGIGAGLLLVGGVAVMVSRRRKQD
nr:LPXTG cell wall anchor domain-containing protein [Brevibacterium sp. 91QC2O2]